MLPGELNVHIRGIAPTIMHNGQTADPANEFAQAMKELTSKRSKSKADFAEISRIEFLASLYLDESGHPAWPGENIEAMIRAAARKQSKGKDVESSLFSNGYWPLIYDGPKSPEKLYADKRFVKACLAVNPGAKTRIMRTRAMFPVWELKFTVNYDTDVIDAEQVTQWLAFAGQKIGLSDWRPRFGRFEVLAIN